MKLSDIDSESVALDGVKRQLRRRWLTALKMEPLRLPRDPSFTDEQLLNSGLGLSLLDLARYATLGEPLDAPASEWAQTLHESQLTDVEPWPTVLAVAVARDKILGNEAVTLSDIAALTGLSHPGVSSLLQRGDMPKADISPGSRGRGGVALWSPKLIGPWLTSRGVKGLRIID